MAFDTCQASMSITFVSACCSFHSDQIIFCVDPQTLHEIIIKLVVECQEDFVHVLQDNVIRVENTAIYVDVLK